MLAQIRILWLGVITYEGILDMPTMNKRLGGASTEDLPNGHDPGPVGALLDEGLVELPAGAVVDGLPAVLAVVLQAGHVGAEERRELAAAARAGALVAHLVVQHVRLHLHLGRGKGPFHTFG